MKSKFSFYKTIILSVASAITLIAVSFAWFSTSNSTTIGGDNSIQYSVGGSTLVVEYFEQDTDGTYVSCTGDFEMELDPVGESKNYKMVVKNVSGGDINLNMSLSDLEAVNTDLLNCVYVDYKVVPVSAPTTEIVTTDFTTADGKHLADYTTNGTLFSTNLSKTTYGTEFEVYYSISLDPDVSIGTFSSASIGKVNLSATVVE